MKVEVIDKGDGTITVRYSAVSPLEASLMPMITLGEARDKASLNVTSANYDKGSITIGSFTTPVIEILRTPEDKPSP